MFQGLWKHPWLRSGAGTLLVLCTVGAAMVLGWLRPADDLFDAMRFRAVPSEASDSLAIVEIDARSLERAGSWPWERERYAAAIDRLIDAGATLVAFDIDFSASSDTASDGALAETISRHPGQVALGAFIQHESFAAGSRELVENRPIGALTQDALIASVNVPVDEDGKVRRYAYDALAHASIAATLAGLNKQGEFAIDYGIDHRSIPHMSFEDILQNRFDPALVKGRVVLSGRPRSNWEMSSRRPWVCCPAWWCTVLPMKASSTAGR